MRWMILVIVGFYLAVSNCASASHSTTECVSCHRQGGIASNPAARSNRASGCVPCHRSYERVFDHSMGQRSSEMQFVQRTYGRFDSEFWEKNCNSCHLKSCLDCHSDGGLAKPSIEACQRCHTGYYTGWDYSGRAPREDNMRYQRGLSINGETYLKMRPDIHFSAGMVCGTCHSMKSLSEGKRSSKVCRDCHEPSQKVVEHRIQAHMQRMECYACHSAWAPQEYGTFFLRYRDQSLKDEFDLKPGPSAEYLRSAYLKKQDAPPLAINNSGKVSPVRPMFISYYTDVVRARNNGPENQLLAAEWRTYFPHTVQRGTMTCEACHDNPGRFLFEPESRRIYDLNKDGMGIESFWLQKGQRVVNGSFMDATLYQQMIKKTPAYTKAYVEKWQKILKHGENSSRQ